MEQKTWNKVLDEYLKDKALTGDPGLIQEMDSFQRYTINEVKKSLKRINAS